MPNGLCSEVPTSPAIRLHFQHLYCRGTQKLPFQPDRVPQKKLNHTSMSQLSEAPGLHVVATDMGDSQHTLASNPVCRDYSFMAHTTSFFSPNTHFILLVQCEAHFMPTNRPASVPDCQLVVPASPAIPCQWQTSRSTTAALASRKLRPATQGPTALTLRLSAIVKETSRGEKQDF